MGSNLNTETQHIVNAIATMGFRVSFQQQEDGHWLAFAKRGAEGKLHLARGATDAMAAGHLAKMLDGEILDITDGEQESTSEPEQDAVDEVHRMRENADKLASDLQSLVEGITQDQRRRENVLGG